MTSNRPLGSLRREGAHGKEGYISGFTSSRNCDETTAMQLADARNQNWRFKKIDKAQLVREYGLKPDIAGVKN